MKGNDLRNINMTIRFSQKEKSMFEQIVSQSKTRETLSAYLRNCILDKAEEDFKKLNK